MRIIFGTYHIGIKDYAPQELGILNDAETPYICTVKQQIFHIFWIPVFPLFKVYALQDKQGNLYHAPETVASLMRNAGKHKVPWYSFSLPILALVVFFAMQLSFKIQHARFQSEMKATQKANVEYITKLTENTAAGDLFVLTMAQQMDYSTHQNNTDKYLIMVDSVKDGHFIVRTGMIASPVSTDHYASENHLTDHSDASLLSLVQSPDFINIKGTMTGKELRSCIQRFDEFGNYYKSGGKKINGYDYFIHHKIALTKPNIWFTRESYSTQKGLILHLNYLGPIAKIVAFKAISGISVEPSYNKILANEDFREFKSEMIFPRLRASDNFNFQLTLQTEDGKQYTFNVWNTGNNCFAVPG